MLEQRFGSAGGIEHVAVGVAGAGVNQGLRGGIELCQKQRHIPLEIHVLSQRYICPRQDFTHICGIHRPGAQIGAGFGHRERGTNSMTGRVGNDNSKTAVGQGQIIEIITAGGFRRIRASGNVKGAELRRGFGEKSLLDFAHHSELLPGLAQLAFGLLSFSPFHRFAQFAFDRRHQSCQVALHDVIVRAVFHGGDRDFFADRAGHNDEGHVEPLLFHQLQGGHCVKLWHGEIGEHDVPILLLEGGTHGGGGINPLKRWIETAAPKLIDQQQRVVFGVLDDQDAERLTHAAFCFRGGGPFITSQ